ncbi:unnamed protein product [Owenia fusiformis]|uniref:Replication stress response regulator SDE2 n=1 Tax=Owenia fusiformis TaxID=6347 RepID=A0A8J1UFF4_OWEFU|nr:unnamed protein product [Owenia fusiformis]
MANIYVSYPNNKSCRKCIYKADIQQNVYAVIRNLEEDIKFLHGDSFYVECNGRRVSVDDLTEEGAVYRVWPRLIGGKGGFGSMLRSLGAQIEKTTNREACRDLSGRRMRDINNEKKLKEWVNKQAKAEKEEDVKRKKLEKHYAVAKPKFNDPTFMEQKSQVAENLEDAVSAGLARAGTSAAAGSSADARKRKANTNGGPSDKRAWLGFDPDDLSDSEDDDIEASHSSEESSNSAKDEEQNSPETPNDSMDLSEQNGKVDKEACDENIKNSVNSTKEDENESTSENKNTKEQMPEIRINPEQPMDGIKESMNVQNTEEPGIAAAQSDSPVAEKSPTTDISESEAVDLDLFKSAAELESVGLDKLKMALIALGLKCGGSIQERAQRLFSVKGLSKDQIDPSLFAKSKGKGKKSK